MMLPYMKSRIFHLAIPCRDLEKARQFYVEMLGAKLARTYDDRITLNFFQVQLVCHLSPDKTDSEPEVYPRHFGITFSDQLEFEDFLALCKLKNLPFFSEPQTRSGGEREEHVTFFLQDPSNNLIEFKHYLDHRMMY